MSKINIIICYMGELPWYFNFFMKSCSYNPSIHFSIITDNCLSAFTLPSNVKFIHSNLEKIERLATKKLGFPVKISSGHKLSDIRPAFGLIFNELIEGYDFWGYSDIDLVYGDIRNFMDDNLLGRFDIVSVRPEYLTGFFALYRNDSCVNRLFLNSPDCRYVFQQNEYCGFDECAELCFELMDGKKLSDLPAKIRSMTHLIRQQFSKVKINVHFDLLVIEFTPGNLAYKEGKLIYNCLYEVLLYHLNGFKSHPNLEVPNWTTIPESYDINEYSFTKIKSQFRQQNIYR